MQPIAFDTEILRYLFDNWDDSKLQREFYKLSENLEVFHQVFIDKSKGRSEWFNQFREIRDSLNDQNIKKTFDELIGPRNIKYVAKEIDNADNLITSIANQTPDKIAVVKDNLSSKNILQYNLKRFNNQQDVPDCLLFRIPKNMTIPPNKIYREFKILAPFIREANKLEFCDPFLFRNFQFDNDYNFILDVIKMCPNVDELEIFCDPNSINPLQRKLKRELKKKFQNIKFDDFKKYNSRNNDVNHDRFIIVNDDKISIRFTSSFNNLRQTDDGSYIVKDSFLIEISKGRKYYD